MGHYENNNILERETEGRKYLQRERNGERGKWGGEKKRLVRGEMGGGGVNVC